MAKFSRWLRWHLDIGEAHEPSVLKERQSRGADDEKQLTFAD
jgi:hypothetical protein